MFTVRQLARLAGVTPRTLHHYDAIGLLKPSRIGENGYRYYDEQALLRLQQILFYRELDMPLEDIKRLMGRRGFDVLEALQGHRHALERKAARLSRLIETVDNTILHMKGRTSMSAQDLFQGFTEEEEQKYTEEAMRMYDPETVRASVKKWKGYTAAEKQRIGEEGNALFADLKASMPKGAASPEAQAAIARWRHYIEYFWIPNDDQLLGLADLYNEDHRFRENIERAGAGLPQFMREAVRIYVEKRRGAR